MLQKIAGVVIILYALSLACCSGSPSTLKTLELTPKGIFQGKSHFGGQQGYCLSGSGLTTATFFPGPGQLMVGFDNRYSSTFLCDELRALTFRGLIDFDVSQFDSIVSASLTFEAQRSIERIHATTGQVPPKSYANALGLAISPITRHLFYDTEAPGYWIWTLYQCRGHAAGEELARWQPCQQWFCRCWPLRPSLSERLSGEQ
jgi:hypothetical protein